MNRMNNIWSLNNQANNLQNMFNPQQAQLLLLQQQIQQHLSQQQEQREQPKFNSSFSVNNLLGQSRPVQQNQIAAALTQQIAAAMVNNYRQQLTKLHRPIYPDSAFHQPNKRLRNNDFEPTEINQLNTSTSSISSPSSSSTTSALLDYSSLNHNNLGLNESDYAINNDNISERNSPDLLSYSSSSSSSCSFSIKRSNDVSTYSNGLIQCPICGLEMNSSNDLRLHFNYELSEIAKIDAELLALTNQKRDSLSKNSRYLKFEEIKENRMKRSMRRSIQRLMNSKENIETCKTNLKSIKKREFDEIDCELSTGTMKSKRSKLDEEITNLEEEESVLDELTNKVEEEENDEYINVVDNDDDENLNQDSKNFFNDSDLDSQENNLSNSSKCTNCLQIFKNNALVSVNCWHVNCKTCWLKSINENKNCPQCCTQTLPKHLKKIIL
ncbi:unnamed protein product [Brachionus calyciflorus]|uniref:RING-type domain-containing protein n=1 Tax=Brachionus calyciflorus TaxID=104777 RepID=A0A814FDL1_9BILA|nr:unnamed protein product [Brachionus calyciflorus]